MRLSIVLTETERISAASRLEINIRSRMVISVHLHAREDMPEAFLNQGQRKPRFEELLSRTASGPPHPWKSVFVLAYSSQCISTRARICQKHFSTQDRGSLN